MEEVKSIVREAFGESSNSEGEEEEYLDAHSAENLENGKRLSSESVFGESHNWESITEIDGLWLCKDFLSTHQQSNLLSSIQKEGWFAASSSNQAMRFGDLPGWAVELSSSIHEVILFSNYAAELENYETGKEACIFPQDLLWREPIFDQLIVNMYQPAEGICPHVDLMRFEDGIAIVSLESTCVMHFSRVENDTSGVQDPQHKVPVLLTPGCLILMWGEARYLWKHEINRKPGIQIWEGQEIDQKRRISVTLRKLCQTE
ncbi:putative DEAD-box ATP-dependent RNA helicase 24 [Capsicum annuum]|nr:alkylated DNA repair protein alkB homolog 8 isoform X2 [Capsicum annuum]KAF3622332.1 putative DEAD-box ATP-dependent RNA helicase 24 [Capsicum annuum]